MLSTPSFWLAIAGVVGLLAAGLLWWRGLRPSASELERRRRLAIHSKNRVIEGLVTDADEGSVQFRYDLRGIEYFASQDVASLRQFMPARPELWIGPVGVKFDPANPANSIVVCEGWSGWQSHHSQRGNQWKSVSA